MLFQKLGLKPQLLQVLKEQFYTQPTPIQSKAIPLILNNKDIIAQAQTGSGKSASFILPTLHLWSNNPYEGKAKIKILVITPTRELSIQVASIFKSFSKFLTQQPKIVTIIGGKSIGEQLYDIQKGCDIVVATAGRLLDIINKQQINLSHIDFFILDEADKMLSLSFEDELNSILNLLPQARQNLLFSATFPQKAVDLISKITKTATKVTIDNQKKTIPNIHQRAILVNMENRSALLRFLIKNNSYKTVLVFMANKRASYNLSQKFIKYGFSADFFHGDMLQEDRNIVLQKFKDNKIQVLFTTDIISRGLDILDISCVINYDLPRSPSDYIHRIGRTGRAGSSGEAISFITLENNEHFALIEKKVNISLQKEQIDGFERNGEVVKKIVGQLPIKGKRKSKKDKLREMK